MPFRGRRPGTPDLDAHADYSSVNPVVALQHYRGVDYLPAGGERHLKDLLDTYVR